MRSPSLLLATAAAVALIMVVAALAFPGALAEQRADRTRPGHVELSEITVAPGAVSGDSADLVIDAYLTHRGGDSQNISVVYRAIDGESGMVETVERTELGNVSTDGEVVTTQTLTVDREGSYRIEILVYQDRRRVSAGGKRIAGVETLTPEYARSSVSFHRFDGGDLPPISFAVEEAGANQTTLDTSAYLTNHGSATSGLRLEIIARQADSNIVAARQTVQLDRIEAGETVTPSTRLSVPSGYNYYLDAILWKDGVIVGTTSAAANLDPQRRISVNETVEDVGLEVSDFEIATEADEVPEPTDSPEESDAVQTPGFGIGVAVLALLGGALLFGRRNHD